jgi:SNF family Na+-dependent transporter
MGLLKLILILGILYYVSKIVGWLILPFFSHRFSGAVKNQYDENFQQLNKEAKQKEGKITIKDPGNKNKSFSKDDGEYTDYEEIR